MAAAVTTGLSPLRHLLLSSASQPLSSARSPLLRSFARISLPALALPTVSSTVTGISTLLQDLWDGLLRAVPKKKTTHSKSRSRRLAGKALKDLTNLNRCSGCGRVKRMHVLCPYCVQNIKDMWAGRMKKITAEATKLVKK